MTTDHARKLLERADELATYTEELVDRVAEAVAATGAKVRRLPSDAVTMARMTDTAMLFVRCAGGISHHPDESVSEHDVALAIEAATHFVHSLKGV